MNYHLLHSVGYNIIFNKCSVSHTKVKSYSVLSNACYISQATKDGDATVVCETSDL